MRTTPVVVLLTRFPLEVLLRHVAYLKTCAEPLQQSAANPKTVSTTGSAEWGCLIAGDPVYSVPDRSQQAVPGDINVCRPCPGPHHTLTLLPGGSGPPEAPLQLCPCPCWRGHAGAAQELPSPALCAVLIAAERAAPSVRAPAAHEAWEPSLELMRGVSRTRGLLVVEGKKAARDRSPLTGKASSGVSLLRRERERDCKRDMHSSEGHTIADSQAQPSQ